MKNTVNKTLAVLVLTGRYKSAPEQQYQEGSSSTKLFICAIIHGSLVLLVCFCIAGAMMVM